MKRIWTILIFVLITGVIVGGGIYIYQGNKAKVDPFTYTENDQLFSVAKNEYPITDKFSASTLKNQSEECGTNKTEQYYQNLLDKFGSADKVAQYTFAYKGGESQDSNKWFVTVIPNKLGYTSADNFKTDFDTCYAAGALYPTLESSDYLLFESSCGSGGDDGSDKPHGCEEVRKAVQSTIKLK